MNTCGCMCCVMYVCGWFVVVLVVVVAVGGGGGCGVYECGGCCVGCI